MSGCVSQAVIRRSKPLNVRRPRNGTYDAHGRWQTREQDPVAMSGDVQPLRPEEILRLEDSRHIRAAIKIYTTDEFLPVSPDGASQPDIVVHNGKEFEVESVGNWEDFFKVIAVRREVQP